MISLLGYMRSVRLHRAMRDYPIVSIPHPFRETELSRAQALENFSFFLEQRRSRIIVMREWFGRHFRLEIELTAQGVRSFSRWVDRYGMFVMNPYNSEFAVAWDTYKPAWVGYLRSLNLVYDTAVFYGEYIIDFSPLHWIFYDEKPLVPGKRTQSYYRPTLAGLSVNRKIDPLKNMFDMYRLANGERAALLPGVKRRFLDRVDFAEDSAINHPLV